jgi:hypothetical protein
MYCELGGSDKRGWKPATEVILGMEQVSICIATKPINRQFYQRFGTVTDDVFDFEIQDVKTSFGLFMPRFVASIISAVVSQSVWNLAKHGER